MKFCDCARACSNNACVSSCMKCAKPCVDNTECESSYINCANGCKNQDCTDTCGSELIACIIYSGASSDCAASSCGLSQEEADCVVACVEGNQAKASCIQNCCSLSE